MKINIPMQPLSGTPINAYFRLLIKHRFNVELKYLPKLIYTCLISTVAITPISILEKILTKNKIENIKLRNDPIFIIGHWRSGTTFLHYLMSQDEQFGFLTNAQSFCPGSMYASSIPIIKSIINIHLPDKRPMDDMKITMGSPQEEEFALANLSHQSCYHWWNFPKKMKHYFNKYVLLNDLTKSEYQAFVSTYWKLIQKISYVNNQKLLLLKNPANTGRIPMLLSLFPNAKFIYLHRTPHDVYHSTVKLHSRLLDCFSFQSFSQKEIEKNTRTFYTQLMRKYQKDKALIPIENLIEIDFKTLTGSPLPTLEKIYGALQLKGYAKSLNGFKGYLEEVKDYQAEEYKSSQYRNVNLRVN